MREVALARRAAAQVEGADAVALPVHGLARRRGHARARRGAAHQAAWLAPGLAGQPGPARKGHPVLTGQL